MSRPAASRESARRDGVRSVREHLLRGFADKASSADGADRRIGAELKFPFVNPDGSAVVPEKVDALWAWLSDRGWSPTPDSTTGRTVGASRPGPRNDTLASCETGYCKPEFSLAHVGDLFELAESIRVLRGELRGFCDAEGVRMIGCGIHPVSRPRDALLMKKTRTSVWDRIFGSNRVIAPADGDDVCLFTVNAASHVHVSVAEDEAIEAVNVLCGFAGPQIALTANSSVWRGEVDAAHKCVAEKFWDWWMPEGDRVGVPPRPFADLADYAAAIAAFRPVYAKRDGEAILLRDYDTFADYLAADAPTGRALDGSAVPLAPQPADIDLHTTCFWHNARVSRYFTVENRACDQQPPEELVTIAALTLGLVCARGAAWEELRACNWDDLRAARDSACRRALAGEVGGTPIADLARRMLEIAAEGLRARQLGEEEFLTPLLDRCERGWCPADDAADLFRRGAETLVADRSL